MCWKEGAHFPYTLMHTLRFSLLSIATVFSTLTPVAASACGGLMKEDAVMMTPLSLRGEFIFTTRLSRRHLRKEIAERQQKEQPSRFIGLQKEIL